MTDGYQALRTAAAWVDQSARGKIIAKGRDRARWLHNITTQHIKELQPGQGRYAFLLTPQGRIQADVVVLCFEDHFLLSTEPETREKALAHIRRYIIADQVELEDVTEKLAAIGVEGLGAAGALAALGAPLPAEPFAHLPWDDVLVVQAGLTGAPAYRLVIDVARKDELLRKLESGGITPATLEEARVVRLENGRPRYGEDIFDTTLPQETRQMHALHFNKGCYLGQEIVERIRSRGHVNKQLMSVEIETAEPPVPGTKLMAGSAEAGEMASSAFSPASGKVVGLAYIRTPHAQPGAELTAGEHHVRILR